MFAVKTIRTYELTCGKCSESFRSRNPHQKLCWRCMYGADVADRQERRWHKGRRRKKIERGV